MKRKECDTEEAPRPPKRRAVLPPAESPRGDPAALLLAAITAGEWDTASALIDAGVGLPVPTIADRIEHDSRAGPAHAYRILHELLQHLPSADPDTPLQPEMAHCVGSLGVLLDMCSVQNALYCVSSAAATVDLQARLLRLVPPEKVHRFAYEATLYQEKHHCGWHICEFVKRMPRATAVTEVTGALLYKLVDGHRCEGILHRLLGDLEGPVTCVSIPLLPLIFRTALYKITDAELQLLARLTIGGGDSSAIQILALAAALHDRWEALRYLVLHSEEAKFEPPVFYCACKNGLLLECLARVSAMSGSLPAARLLQERCGVVTHSPEGAMWGAACAKSMDIAEYTLLQVGDGVARRRAVLRDSGVLEAAARLASRVPILRFLLTSLPPCDRGEEEEEATTLTSALLTACHAGNLLEQAVQPLLERWSGAEASAAGDLLTAAVLLLSTNQVQQLLSRITAAKRSICLTAVEAIFERFREGRGSRTEMTRLLLRELRPLRPDERGPLLERALVEGMHGVVQVFLDDGAVLPWARSRVLRDALHRFADWQAAYLGRLQCVVEVLGKNLASVVDAYVGEVCGYMRR